MTSAQVEIRPVQTRTDKKAFVELPWKIYRDDPNWVPPLLSMAYADIDVDNNPFYEFARLGLFNGWRGSELVGRIAAIDNPRHNETHKDRVGFFGFFESENDEEVARALMDAAGNWLKERGKDAVRGPANPSVNAVYGLLVDGFDSPPVVLTPHNPAYYAGLIEGCGLEKAMDLWMWYLPTSIYGGIKADKLPKKLTRVAKAVRKRYGYTVRNPNLKDFDSEVAKLKKVYQEAWEKNWGAVPMTDHEIEHMVAELKRMADLDLIFFVEDRDGNVVGISITLPDLNQALIKAYPRPGVPEPWTLIKLVWHWKVRGCIKAVSVPVLGVLEPYRGRGVDALLMYETAQVGLSKGYEWAEMGWTLQTNEMMNRSVEMMHGRKYRTFRLYQKPL